MKVLLINPPQENMITSEVPSIINGERGFNPPLGLLYVATYLIKNSDYEVKVLDALLEQLSYNQIAERIKKENPDIVAMSVMTFTLLDCLKVALIAKSVNSRIKIVFGGIHVNAFPTETINLPEVDYVVLGEGEIPFCNLLNKLDKPSELKGVKGIAFKDIENNIVNTGAGELIMDLDKIPFPDRRLTPYKKYYSLIAKNRPVTTMITSRGCPYKCTFCDRPHLGKTFRARSADNVLREIEDCVSLGIREILIYDDTFTIDRQRVVDICMGLLKRKIDIGWDIRARVNTVDPELLRLLRKAGCERIHYGVESGNQRILNVLKKGITLQQVEKAFKWTRKAGIETLAYFMIGSPRETKGTIMQTINFAKKIRPDYTHFTVTTPFPTSDMYLMGLREGILKRDYWRDFATKPSKEFVPRLWEENLKREEILHYLNLAYKKFYFSPRVMLRLGTKSLTSFDTLKNYSKAALRILLK
ncbi:B12-binding domain-containing radical SAM protein [Candidatus Woesearchaeota archaeon]|nr:B12-binding domain-containing radical SAM protein [Candidatus Woesearchaeota archaeon]